jgi:hypothetical protein
MLYRSFEAVESQRESKDCKQEFSLSCQPIARVAATARFESVYVTVNTVLSDLHRPRMLVGSAASNGFSCISFWDCNFASADGLLVQGQPRTAVL